MRYDIFFLSYDEPNAEEHWELLRKRFPAARRVHGTSGLWHAHAHCAKLSSEEMFYVVDGDNIVCDDFDFSFRVPKGEPWAVRVWRCRNAVNDLVYGYGAIKLYPRAAFQKENSLAVDVATSTQLPYKKMPELASVTEFNGSEFHAWRGAFRECAKLAGRAIVGRDEEAELRLQVWCSRGIGRPFGASCLLGARAGRAFGQENQGNQVALAQINDFNWLRDFYHGRR